MTPSVSLQETLTDNVRLSSSDRQSDLITDVAPGLRIDGAGARGKLSLDYRLHQLNYARDTVGRRTQNALDATGTVEAVENWLFLDVRGNVSQQSVSAFGTQAPDNASVTDNRTETSTYRVSPYARGRLGGAAEYQLRYGWTTTRSDSAVLTTATTEEWAASAKSLADATVFAWSLDATRQRVEYGSGRASEADRVRGVFGYRADPQFQVSLIGGHEANDYASLTKEGRNTYGLGIDWSPGATTRLSAMKERRIFGNGHSLSLSHRTPLSAWKFTDTRDIQLLPSQFAYQSLRTYYDLFDLMAASSFPDPAMRAAKVTEVMQLFNIPLNEPIASGFLASNVFVERRREASFALLGANNVITLAASDSNRRAYSPSSALLLGDFAAATDIRQRGLQIDWSHKMSPRSSLQAVASWLRSIGSGGGTGLASLQRTMRLTFATRIGPRTSLSLGARHAVFDSSGAGYRENALLAVLSVTF